MGIERDVSLSLSLSFFNSFEKAIEQGFVRSLFSLTDPPPMPRTREKTSVHNALLKGLFTGVKKDACLHTVL